MAPLTTGKSSHVSHFSPVATKTTPAAAFAQEAWQHQRSRGQGLGPGGTPGSVTASGTPATCLTSLGLCFLRSKRTRPEVVGEAAMRQHMSSTGSSAGPGVSAQRTVTDVVVADGFAISGEGHLVYLLVHRWHVGLRMRGTHSMTQPACLCENSPLSLFLELPGTSHSS